MRGFKSKFDARLARVESKSPLIKPEVDALSEFLPAFPADSPTAPNPAPADKLLSERLLLLMAVPVVALFAANNIEFNDAFGCE